MKNSLAEIHKYVLNNPKDLDALSALAESYREAGNVKQALATFKRIIDIDGRNYIVLNNYAALLNTTKEYSTASKLLQLADKLLPNSPVILSNLAISFTGLGRFKQAVKIALHAVHLQPDFFDAIDAAGNALHMSGKYTEAIPYLEAALKLRPDSTINLVRLSDVYHHLGNDEKAYQVIKPSLDNNEPDVAAIYFRISKSLGLREHAANYILSTIKNLRKQKLKQPIPPGLYSSMGKYYDETGRYDDAYTHYHMAGKLYNRKFEIADVIRQFDEIITSNDEISFASLDNATNITSQPVFIIGMPRSGTTLCEQILSSHSQVFGAGELDLIPTAVAQAQVALQIKNADHTAVSLNTKQLDDMANSYLEHINSLSNSSPRVVDKMPHNFVYTGLIARLFPAAKIINVVRHPLDNCLSCYFSEFGVSTHNYSYDINNTAKYYAQYNRLMKHWMALYDNRILQIRYEDLVMDHENTCKKLISYCGLEWEEQCLEFHKNTRTINTISYDQVNQPIYKKSVSRWKNYSKYLGKAKIILADAIQTHASI